MGGGGRPGCRRWPHVGQGYGGFVTGSVIAQDYDDNRVIERKMLVLHDDGGEIVVAVVSLIHNRDDLTGAWAEWTAYEGKAVSDGYEARHT